MSKNRKDRPPVFFIFKTAYPTSHEQILLTQPYMALFLFNSAT